MNREVRDKLIVEALRGGCWHEWSFRSAAYMCSQESDYECEKCNEWKSDQEFNNLSTPKGFFWALKKAKKMPWWDKFLSCYLNGYLGETSSQIEELNHMPLKYIDPDTFANTLSIFLGELKNESMGQ